MEDWLHFVETFSSYIFKGDVLPEALRALCWSLCSTVTHYFRPRPPDETREQFLVAAKAAACKLRAYTTRLEELEVPGYMFTVNLHICVCWLYSDLPVERMMQQMKTQGGRMVSQAPEKHYAQWLCLMRASESLTEADPGTGAKHTTNQQLERMLARRAVNTEAAWFDKPGANGYLLGRGHMVYPSPERVAQVRAAMASLVHWYALAFEDVASWTLGPSASYELDTDRLDRVLMSTPPDCPKARSLLHAEALDEEQYFGAEYGRQQQRISCWACYQAEASLCMALYKTGGPDEDTTNYDAFKEWVGEVPRAAKGAAGKRRRGGGDDDDLGARSGCKVGNKRQKGNKGAGRGRGASKGTTRGRGRSSGRRTGRGTGRVDSNTGGGAEEALVYGENDAIQDEDTTNYDAFKEWVGEVPRAAKGAAGKRRRGGGDDDDLGARSGCKVGNKRQKGNKGAGRGRGASKGTTRGRGRSSGGRTGRGTGRVDSNTGGGAEEALVYGENDAIQDEDTTNYDAFKEWVGEVPRAAKGAAGKRRRGGGDDDDLGARSGRKVGNKRQKGNKGAGWGRGASKGTTRGRAHLVESVSRALP
ncbi:hypothetical protein VOLCADRAFT_105580 [Volvox carteri f. nagariensis]|uniref:Uncharacterized protein n=1 Tax=Volvox carteri f. nagariensis TaxID=3068 RepID=D8U1N7_VOLCA|nr:uncharacterized protein VOLCADRAFT_105580 [Volvox carteri f. nagariensis]EFJ46372.1 hypothetical protein VOLCADRAFT_105580 [Volvox carteri f. nagariensis]|eukprot:XP_002952525.1 hypothetical protein VOLCADRAFT_105580 [Volvox carteri f. nagariensis]